MISVRRGPGPAGLPVEVVERKGLGHPVHLRVAISARAAGC
jgi:S-adenosylmethionine synthetase